MTFSCPCSEQQNGVPKKKNLHAVDYVTRILHFVLKYLCSTLDTRTRVRVLNTSLAHFNIKKLAKLRNSRVGLFKIPCPTGYELV